MVVNPATDTLYVSNINARNHVRFSGVASRATTTVRGHVTDQRITAIGSFGKRVLAINKHIDFTVPTGTAQERDTSLSTLLGMAVSQDGQTLYVCAFGSDKIGIFDTMELENDSFVPDQQNQIEVSGGGPSGIALDEINNRAFVLTRFDNGISTLDLTTRRETATTPVLVVTFLATTMDWPGTWENRTRTQCAWATCSYRFHRPAD
jgi:DNA-binding beta-propeller fold protein YncE